MWQQNKGYANTCTNQPVDSLQQTFVIAQVDECIGPVGKNIHVFNLICDCTSRQVYGILYSKL